MKWDVLFETFQPFQTHHESCLFETFRWDLKKRCYLKLLKLEMFQTHHGGVAYLKLSNETWNEMCYLKLFNLFKPIMRAAYLKLSDETRNKICYLKFLKLETFQTCHGGVAYFKLSDETWKRGAIWNVWNLKLFKHVMGGSLFETFRWDLKWDVLFETFLPFQTHHKSCLF